MREVSRHLTTPLPCSLSSPPLMMPPDSNATCHCCCGWTPCKNMCILAYRPSSWLNRVEVLFGDRLLGEEFSRHHAAMHACAHHRGIHDTDYPSDATVHAKMPKACTGWISSCVKVVIRRRETCLQAGQLHTCACAHVHICACGMDQPLCGGHYQTALGRRHSWHAQKWHTNTHRMQIIRCMRACTIAGWINNCVEAFIRDSFGQEAWLAILAESGVQYPWVSSCPCSDTITYE